MDPQMIKLSLSRLAVAVGGLALSLTAGAGVASADPLDPIVNTTCSYPQVMSALNAQDPATAAAFTSSPESTSFLSQFLASPPNQRLRMARMIQNTPGIQQNFGLIQQVFNTCSNY
jgi:hemophore-related protein